MTISANTNLGSVFSQLRLGPVLVRSYSGTLEARNRITDSSLQSKNGKGFSRALARAIRARVGGDSRLVQRYGPLSLGRRYKSASNASPGMERDQEAVGFEGKTDF